MYLKHIKRLTFFVFFIGISGASMSEIKDSLTMYSNFPKQGINFVDISTLLASPPEYENVIENFYERYKEKNINLIIGMESRGFIFGSTLAYKMKVPFVMARKPGKLPGEVISYTYEKEYGSDTLQIPKYLIKPGDHVLVIDDLIATGGTAQAVSKLISHANAKLVEVAVVVELTDVLKENSQFNLPLYSVVKL